MDFGSKIVVQLPKANFPLTNTYIRAFFFSLLQFYKQKGIVWASYKQEILLEHQVSKLIRDSDGN